MSRCRGLPTRQGRSRSTSTTHRSSSDARYHGFNELGLGLARIRAPAQRLVGIAVVLELDARPLSRPAIQALARELGDGTPVWFLMGPAVPFLLDSNRESRVRVGCNASRPPATRSVTSRQKRMPCDSRAWRGSGGGQHRRASEASGATNESARGERSVRHRIGRRCEPPPAFHISTRSAQS